jgi:heat shock protein HslJ
MFDRCCIVAATLALAAPLVLARRSTEIQSSAESEHSAHPVTGTVQAGQQPGPGGQPSPPTDAQQVPPPDNSPAKPLTGTHWTLTQLNGKPVSPESSRKEAYIELTAETNRISGSGGCNRLTGSYEIDGASLHFRQVASTMMACPGDVMPREQEFIKALSAAAGFRIHGSTLLLRDKDGVAVARFEARSEAQAEPKP